MKLFLLLILLGSSALGQTTQRASIRTSADDDSVSCAISADGRFVAFSSSATNLVPNDTNGYVDVFVRDLQGGTTERVSIATDGSQSNGHSFLPSISADGRFVAFASKATNLVPGDTGQMDVFVRDRLNGTTERISVSTGGAQGGGISLAPSISADGRYVAFSSSSNFGSGGFNSWLDVWVRDRQNGTTEQVSVDNNGIGGNSQSDGPSISADGRFVAFESLATNLVPGDTNNLIDAFVRDRVSGTTVRVSVDSSGAQQTGGSGVFGSVAISADGRYVAFASGCTNLVPGDLNGHIDTFVHDLIGGTTELVSVSSSGAQGDGDSYDIPPAISGDGRYVTFSSAATNFFPGDSGFYFNLFVHDRQSGSTEQISVSVSGGEADQHCEESTISADGRYVGFVSRASNLVPGDINSKFDVFTRDRLLGATELVSAADVQANSFSDEPSISTDGRCIAFRSNASNLVPLDTNIFYDVFVYDRPSASLDWVSATPNGAGSNGPNQDPVISSDGRYVAFSSQASNLIVGDTNNALDIFLRDRQSFTTTRVSVASDGSQADSNSYTSAISGDGRYIAFDSDASNLVASDTNNTRDIFVRDVVNATTERVSVASDGTQANNFSQTPAISADGRFVVFGSYATNLVAAGTSGSTLQVFVHDLQLGTTELVSVAPGGGSGDGDSYAPYSISANGRFVAFSSYSTNLVPGDTNAAADIFVRDRQLGTTQRVSVDSSGAQANSSSTTPSISADGRFVAFDSVATNLVPGDTNGQTDVFIHDRVTGTTERMSVATGGTQGNFASDTASISGDGRIVVFRSDASNLVPGDTNNWGDVFLRDRGATSSFTSFCFGDGTGAACPCANNGSAGHGCQNSAGTGGSVLTAMGTASLSADTVVLTASNELSTAISVFLQGNSVVAPTVFADGLRCAGGSLKRLYTKHAAGGVTSAPQAGDPSITARSAALGDTITLGSTRVYQVYYRDANLTFCPGGFNISNGILVAWGS
jgi:hypothetical protein